MQKYFMLLAISGPLLTGCTAFSPNDVANPSNLTVDNALAQVGKGFHDMREELNKDDNGKPKPLGLYACKVTVSLNVTAAADQGGKLTLDLSAKPPATSLTDVTGAIHAEQTNTSSATRGNNINVEMYNPACLPKDTLGHDTPDKVKTVFDAEHTLYSNGTSAAQFATPFVLKK